MGGGKTLQDEGEVTLGEFGLQLRDAIVQFVFLTLELELLLLKLKVGLLKLAQPLPHVAVAFFWKETRPDQTSVSRGREREGEGKKHVPSPDEGKM